MTIGSLFDIGIIVMSSRIRNLYDDEDVNDTKHKATKLLLKDNDNENGPKVAVKEKTWVYIKFFIFKGNIRVFFLIQLTSSYSQSIFWHNFDGI